MKEKLVTLINILSKNSFLEGPFYINDIIIKNIRLCENEPEFEIEHKELCQFGEFELWMIYNNMEDKHLEIILQRLANLL